jgi:hypothetical protein
MAKRKTTAVNWSYQNKDILSTKDAPENSIGFIYLIENLDNGKRYIGRKAFYATRKKRLTIKEKALPGNSRKTFKTEVTENTWKTYTGSCKPLNEDIKAGARYKKQILRYCFSKKQMSFYELKELFCNGVIEDENYYNGNIAGKFFNSDLIK